MPEETHQVARAEHVALSESFTSRCQQLGLSPDPMFFWYHTIDLGKGLVTPGSFDYRARLQDFGFPGSMAGMTALDVGTATGFFSFELERRGARVTATEIPMLSDWDHFPGESPRGIIAKIRERLPCHSVLPQAELRKWYETMSETELHHILLDGPFRFCHRVLGSEVTRVYSTIHELEQRLGRHKGFDLVLLSDVLLHTIDPLRALAAAAKVCNDTLVISDEVIGSDEDPPLLLYIGGGVAEADAAEWWRPNVSWFRAVLSRLGFRQVEVISTLAGYIRPGGEPYLKKVIQARR